MKLKLADIELMQLMEKKQNLLLKLKVAIALGRMDLVRELSYEFQIIAKQEHLLYNK